MDEVNKNFNLNKKNSRAFYFPGKCRSSFDFNQAGAA